MHSRVLLLLTFISCLVLTRIGVGQEQAEADEATQRLVTITDFDAAGRVVSIRSEMVFDRDGRRLTNKVFDARERLAATERFQYDSQGRLRQREYLTASAKLKWRWQRVKHNNAGQPIRNDIVNDKGKKIGWYIWHYDEHGRLSRRDRFNSDGTLRFYYSDIRRDKHGDFSTWTKYDSKGSKIGSKKWQFAVL